MAATIVFFPRKKPMSWDELPDYWDYGCRRYYEFAIAEGTSHEDAFTKWDLVARRPGDLSALRRLNEGEESYIARIRSIAISPDEARSRKRSAGP